MSWLERAFFVSSNSSCPVGVFPCYYNYITTQLNLSRYPSIGQTYCWAREVAISSLLVFFSFIFDCLQVNVCECSDIYTSSSESSILILALKLEFEGCAGRPVWMFGTDSDKKGETHCWDVTKETISAMLEFDIKYEGGLGSGPLSDQIQPVNWKFLKMGII